MIVLGKNWSNPGGVWFRGEEPTLSVDSKLCSIASGLLYSRGITDNVLFCGGKTLGRQYPGESEEMFSFMLECGFFANSNNVFFERESFDTHGNAQGVKKFLWHHDFSRLALVATQPHIARAKKVFDYHDISTDTLTVEKVIEEERGLSSYIQDYRRSIHYRSDIMREQVLNFVQDINPSGSFLRFAAKALPTRKH